MDHNDKHKFDDMTVVSYAVPEAKGGGMKKSKNGGPIRPPPFLGYR